MADRNSPKLTREELKAQAEAAMAAFKKKGGVVDQGPAVVATAFACSNCGQTGVIGVRADRQARCPRCREPLANPASD